jgi:hypothetical protein
LVEVVLARCPPREIAHAVVTDISVEVTALALAWSDECLKDEMVDLHHLLDTIHRQVYFEVALPIGTRTEQSSRMNATKSVGAVERSDKPVLRYLVILGTKPDHRPPLHMQHHTGCMVLVSTREEHLTQYRYPIHLSPKGDSPLGEF